jgi:hypothetical protein
MPAPAQATPYSGETQLAIGAGWRAHRLAAGGVAAAFPQVKGWRHAGLRLAGIWSRDFKVWRRDQSG